VESASQAHPVRLVVTDDLLRSRLTVFFRLLLAIPHLLWLGLWSVVAFVIAVINWFATLIKGQSPQGLHDFLAGYLRYATHVEAYLLLAGNPYPPFFVGSTTGPYPVDLQVDPPVRQNRWKTFFRGFLSIPAVLLALVFLGGPIAWVSLEGGGIAGAAGFLLWFSILVRGRATRGLRDIAAWSIGYGAHVAAYLFLLTERYPYTGPKAHLAGLEPPEVSELLPRLANDDDLRRSRLTVLLRLPLAFPHIVWLILWTVVAFLASIANWFSALAIGRSPRPLARFLSAYIRYATHVGAFLYVAGNPFPGFVGRAGSYPVDVNIDPFARQSRWITLFRLPLVVPAVIVSSAAGGVALFAAFFGWFVALVRGRMPDGLQAAMAYSIGYSAQLSAYAFVLTDRYPHSSPQAVFAGSEPVQLTLPGAGTETLDSGSPGAFV
jgi:Domain of unknown function (DUF4389)